MDDILVHWRSQEEHDRQLVAVLHCLQEVDLTLNEKKCEFSQPSVKFLGMTNQLGKFSRHLADETKPLRDLLSSKNQWCREEPQQKAFVKVKEEISRSPEIALFDPGQETIVSADASSYGLGAVLLQKQASGERRGTSPSNIIKVEETRIQQLNNLHEMLPVIFTYLT